VSFLAPLFLAGAAAVALPFIFHLIRRSSRERVLFSSLMFLEPSPPRITKRSRLEHILLLLLRCAVLSLLALAFARPFFSKPMAPSKADNQSSRVAILIDSSASMRREDLWNQAKQRATETVQKAAASDAVAIYTFDQQLRKVLSFADAARLAPNERAAAAETRLAGISPGWSGTHLGRAMISATEELVEELNRDAQEQGNTALRMIIVSDLQSGASLDGLQGFEWPKKLQIELIQLRGKQTGNAGLHILEENRQLFSSVTNQPVRVRVANSVESKVDQLTLQWRAGNDAVGENLRLYVPAGQSRISAAPAKPTNATVLALSGDEVDFDNLAYAAETQSRPLAVAYLGNEAADDSHGMRYYLHRAFEQTNLSTHVLAITNNFVPAEAASAGMLVIGEALSPEGADLARNLLRQGRTVLVPFKDPASANTVSTLLGGILVSAEEAQVSNYALFGRIDFQHPLFAPFSDARFSDFTKIHFWKYRTMNLASVTNANVITSFDSGAPLLAEIPVERGRVLVMGSTWIPSDSQFALSTKFIPLLFGILEQSANVRSVSHQYTIGDSVPLPPGVEEVVVPDGARKKVSGRTFSETSVPGIYTAGDFQFAVNLDANESKLKPLAPEDLRSLGVPLSLPAHAENADAATARERERRLLATETEARQKLWRNFLIAALAFVFIETYLSSRLSRRLSAA
jgi:hypothetical protein